MVRFVALLSAILVPATVSMASNATPSPRAIFARHDPEHRLPNTDIKKLGVIHVGTTKYSIYYLDFTNPVSRHGQQRIAIIKNDRQFAGAYECTLGSDKYDGKLHIGKDRLTVRLDRYTYVIRFDEKGPTRNKSFCGWGRWENSI